METKRGWKFSKPTVEELMEWILGYFGKPKMATKSRKEKEMSDNKLLAILITAVATVLVSGIGSCAYTVIQSDRLIAKSPDPLALACSIDSQNFKACDAVKERLKPLQLPDLEKEEK